MKEKKKMKKLLITSMLIAAGIVMMGGSTVKAAILQANSTTHDNPATKIGATWISEIRKMEATGQTMGLNESQNEDLTPIGSNNIDVHMMRTTEYGAMAILSASGFGNPKKLSEVEIQTTTGNVTGVYINTKKWEWTAGVFNEEIVGKNARYYDLYTTTKGDAKVGDALGLVNSKNPGCAVEYKYPLPEKSKGWHGAGYSEWNRDNGGGFIRGNSGIFSFIGYWNSNDWNTANFVMRTRMCYSWKRTIKFSIN